MKISTASILLLLALVPAAFAENMPAGEIPVSQDYAIQLKDPENGPALAVEDTPEPAPAPEDFYDPSPLSEATPETVTVETAEQPQEEPVETYTVAYTAFIPVPEEKPQPQTEPVYEMVNAADAPNAISFIFIKYPDGTREAYMFNVPLPITPGEKPEDILKRTNPDKIVVKNKEGLTVRETLFHRVGNIRRISMDIIRIYAYTPEGKIDRGKYMRLLTDYTYMPNGGVQIRRELLDYDGQTVVMPDGSPNPSITTTQPQ